MSDRAAGRRPAAGGPGPSADAAIWTAKKPMYAKSTAHASRFAITERVRSRRDHEEARPGARTSRNKRDVIVLVAGLEGGPLPPEQRDDADRHQGGLAPTSTTSAVSALLKAHLRCGWRDTSHATRLLLKEEPDPAPHTSAPELKPRRRTAARRRSTTDASASAWVRACLARRRAPAWGTRTRHRRFAGPREVRLPRRKRREYRAACARHDRGRTRFATTHAARSDRTNRIRRPTLTCGRRRVGPLVDGRAPHAQQRGRVSAVSSGSDSPAGGEPCAAVPSA